MAPGPDQWKQTMGHLDRINLVLDDVEENKDEHEEEEERGKTVENRKKKKEEDKDKIAWI